MAYERSHEEESEAREDPMDPSHWHRSSIIFINNSLLASAQRVPEPNPLPDPRMTFIVIVAIRCALWRFVAIHMNPL